MDDTARFITELLALLGALVILVRELRLTRREMNGMKDQLVREVSKAAFAAGIKSEKEQEEQRAERNK